MMLNCYKPLAAPRQDDEDNKDGKVPNGESATKPVAAARATRRDGRTPYDMRQVRASINIDTLSAYAKRPYPDKFAAY